MTALLQLTYLSVCLHYLLTQLRTELVTYLFIYSIYLLTYGYLLAPVITPCAYLLWPTCILHRRGAAAAATGMTAAAAVLAAPASAAAASAAAKCSC